MAAPTLQQGIDQAGSPIRLLWKPNPKPFTVPVVAPEYAGWREEQAAWREGVTISDLSHHMSDLFVDGPDATRLLADYSGNDYTDFVVGRAKQFIPVTAEGLLVTDGILMRRDENSYLLSGVPASQSWIRYHGEKGGYDVTFRLDPDSAVRKGGDPVLFRYQIQGPRAVELVEAVFGGPLPKTRFFHSAPVTLGGRSLRALRHGMVGQAGYEFIGEWADGDYVKNVFLEQGEAFGLVHVGGLAYSTNGIESGWIPTPTPAIYTAPGLRDYREWLGLYSYEGQKPLHGSFFSEDIEDYYVSPFEFGYGRSIAFNHEFLGRTALERARDDVPRTKVTFVLDKEDVRRVFGPDLGFLVTYGRYRIERNDRMVGLTFYTGHIGPLGTIIALGLIDKAHAVPGTEVTFVWGEHPGPGTDPEAEPGFQRLKATVQPAPYNEHARTEYRRDG